MQSSACESFHLEIAEAARKDIFVRGRVLGRCQVYLNASLSMMAANGRRTEALHGLKASADIQCDCWAPAGARSC